MMPTFLSAHRIVQIHRDQVNRYGGSQGIRDQGGLESAIAQAEATFGGAFLHEFPHGMAAAYLYHLVQNHPFIDGNKRVGAMAAYVFLRLNGFDLDAPEAEFEALVMSVARGETPKEAITDFFLKWSRAT